VIALPGRLGHDTMYMSSHANDDAVKSCWRWCYQGDLQQSDVDAESCQRQCCRVMLATVLLG
jgi:hypothetical protein